MCGNDQECYKRLSEFQKSKVLEQGQFILKSLDIGSKKWIKMSIARREAYAQACDDVLSKCRGISVEFWFKACKENKSKIPTSKKGMGKVTKDYNAFLEIRDKETEKNVETIKPLS